MRIEKHLLVKKKKDTWNRKQVNPIRSAYCFLKENLSNSVQTFKGYSISIKVKGVLAFLRFLVTTLLEIF